MIERSSYLKKIDEAFEIHSVCGIFGPRQCGKTTVAKYYAKEYFKNASVHYFDLEDPTDLIKFGTPKLTLENLEGLIVIDEIQRRPELFPYLRVFVDKYPDKKILVLGSASRDMLNQSSESLAGRISYVQLYPFSLEEVDNLNNLWARGGFPKSFLAKTNKASVKWRRDFITTFLERDIGALGFDIASYDMRRLWTMVAHYHGSNVNYSDLGRSLSLSDNTIRKYLHLLQSTFMIRLLKPWFANVKKRQIKSPKLYIRDSGIMHTLLGYNEDEMIMHPKIGSSWEGFALEEVIKSLDVDDDDCYYWATSNQAELDLYITHYQKKYAFEFKYSDAPKITKSMYAAIEALELEKLFVIVPGDVNFLLAENIHVMGLKNYLSYNAHD